MLVFYSKTDQLCEIILLKNCFQPEINYSLIRLFVPIVLIPNALYVFTKLYTNSVKHNSTRIL